MKTKELINKYSNILSAIVKTEVKNIKFYVDDREIGELIYEKPKEDRWEGITDSEIYEYRSWGLGTFKVMNGKYLIASFKLYQLQHCCAIMVSCNAYVSPDYRSKGIGTLMNSLRQDIGRVLGYSCIMCTDIDQNVNQRKLLKTNGWKDIHSVVNKRTNNKVYISIVNI